MKRAALTTLLKALGDLLQQLAQDETPKPRPKPPAVPSPPSGRPVMRTIGNRIEVYGKDGEWHAAHFIPREYTRDPDDGGWWAPFDPRRR